MRRLEALSPWLLIAFLAWEVASWVIGAISNDLMLLVTPAATVTTPFVLALILMASFAHDIGQATGAPRAHAMRPAGDGE